MNNIYAEPRSVLQIFVSGSMSKQLLKNYAKEAYLYDAVLVFRGLPNNSFIELANLVMDIVDEKYPVAIQIDDEAFTKFNVKTVPTIVLTRQDESFDKISGNITIKSALEAFALQKRLK